MVLALRGRPVAGGAGLVWSRHEIPPAGRVRVPCKSCTTGIQLDPGAPHTDFAEIDAQGNSLAGGERPFLGCGAHEKGGGSGHDFFPDA
ncbi:hypothetical protein GCM10010214_38180 [Streptomyces abikoensis]|nr:hypothetical protein GCM10010214_38180 [Streptomyces abikoensis]